MQGCWGHVMWGAATVQSGRALMLHPVRSWWLPPTKHNVKEFVENSRCHKTTAGRRESSYCSSCHHSCRFCNSTNCCFGVKDSLQFLHTFCKQPRRDEVLCVVSMSALTILMLILPKLLRPPIFVALWQLAFKSYVFFYACCSCVQTGGDRVGSIQNNCLGSCTVVVTASGETAVHEQFALHRINAESEKNALLNTYTWHTMQSAMHHQRHASLVKRCGDFCKHRRAAR